MTNCEWVKRVDIDEFYRNFFRFNRKITLYIERNLLDNKRIKAKDRNIISDILKDILT